MNNIADVSPNKKVVINLNSVESLSMSYPKNYEVALKINAIPPSTIRTKAPICDVPRFVSGNEASPSINNANPTNANQNEITNDSNEMVLRILNSSTGAI